jgi:hypothetical protein
MSNSFLQVAGSDSSQLYPYWSNIKTPEELGMGTDGNKIGEDIMGLIAYTEVLATGDSAASKTGGPLGNKYFLKSGAQCKPNGNDDLVDRYIYINNVPSGNIPFISSGLGTNFKAARGLIPGAMSNLNAINPFAMLSAFTSGATPECQKLTMETIDVNNNHSTEEHYVAISDIKGMDACIFPGRSNPITGARCREGFYNNELMETDTLPKNIGVQFYLAVLSLLVIYIFYCFIQKTK